MQATCIATGHPQPIITWNKSEGVLPESRTIIQNASLTIVNATVNDSGLYVCTATNSVGTESSFVELTVVRLPYITIQTSFSVFVGQNINVLCPVPAGVNSTVLWMYQNTSVLPDGVVIEGSTVLKITSANVSHNGSYTCIVRNSSSLLETAAQVIIHLRYPATCSSVRVEIANASGHYVIDPHSTQSTTPFTVYCNMTDKGGVGVTVVSHDSEKRTHVKGCKREGCYSRDVSYLGASLSQLSALTDASAYCEQFISYECHGSKLFTKGKGWWVSRDGVRMKYWGGATNMDNYCACGITGTCANPAKLCNCDADDNVWREDSGLLINKSHLPVSQLRFGDIEDKNEGGYHTLGKLKCYGIS